MTNSYLAQKLMTIKLDRNEVSKMKYLRKSNLEERHKLVGSLQAVLSKQASRRTCRLCLRPGRRKIFDSSACVAGEIKYIIGIEISENDGRPQHICKSCEDVVRAATRLKQTAETTQWRLQQELDIVNNATSELEEPPALKPHGGYFVPRGSVLEREWACRKCGRTFHSEAEWNEHDKTSTCKRRSKTCVCETCGREFQSLFLLKRHRLTHTDDPGAFCCAHCPYRARTKYSLVVHARGHSGARPLRCALCAKSFPSAAGLWAHRRRHLPPQHHCTLCGRGYRFKELLIDHIASQHSTEKDFQCCSCGKAFATRKKALRHERRVHNRPRMREVEKIFHTDHVQASSLIQDQTL